MSDETLLEVFDPIREFMTQGQGQMRVYEDRVEIDRKKETGERCRLRILPQALRAVVSIQNRYPRRKRDDDDNS